MPITKDVVYKEDPKFGAWGVDDSDEEEEISPRNCKKLSINNSDNRRILYSIYYI